MISTKCLKGLKEIVCNAPITCNQYKCSAICLRTLLLNSGYGKIISRNLYSSEELPVVKDLNFDKSDEFGTLKFPLEKLYASSKRQTTKKKSPASRVPVSETIDFSSEHLSKSIHSNLDQTQLFEQRSELNEDSEDDEAVSVSYEIKPAKQYLKEMKELDKHRNVKGALALYEEMKQNRVFPQKYIFTFLIGVCGRAGYTKAAFKLFKEMRNKRMEPSSATLTGLFNSCAETPFPKSGLEKAHELRNRMAENAWLPSTITYHAMIKAFGRCGDLQTAFQIVDEMTEAKHALTDETFAFLLMSCISDKEAGFTHAVQVFRKMKQLRIAPSKYHYNLLLRAVRECGVGPDEVASQLLFDWYTYSGRKKIGPGANHKITKTLQIGEGAKREIDEQLLESTATNEIHKATISEPEDLNKTLDSLMTDVKNELYISFSTTPNVLESCSLHGNKVTGLENVHTANDRLMLVGGMDGLLSSMVSQKIEPDIKTITILLDCIPATYESEQLLIIAMDKYNIKPDIDFFNLIIKRRNLRNEYTAAKEILKLTTQYGVNVDIATYGVLALGCDKRELGNKLLSDMKFAGFQPNIEIIGALVSNAATRKDFRYLIDMMNTTKDLEIKPDPKMLEDLEKARRRADKLLAIKDSGKYIYPETLKWCRIFCQQYKPWLQSVGVEIPQHPWKQFKVSNNKTAINANKD